VQAVADAHNTLRQDQPCPMRARLARPQRLL
jgi:hypothetical protein